MSVPDKQVNLLRPLAIIGVVALLTLLFFKGGEWRKNEQRPARPSFLSELENATKNLEEGIFSIETEDRGLTRQRPDSSSIGWQGGAPRVASDPAQGFPKTEDYATSTTLELVVEETPGSIVGWISDDRGLHLEGASVNLLFEKKVEGEEQPTLTTTSDDRGLFAFESVPPSFWTIEVTKESYGKGVLSGVKVASGKRHDPVEIRLKPELLLTGRVASKDKAIEGAVVSLSREELSIHTQGNVQPVRVEYGSATTDEKGAFKIEQLPSGDFQGLVRAAGFARQDFKASVTKDADPLTITLVPEAQLGGVVRNQLDKPVSGATLSLFKMEGDLKNPVATATSSEEGIFLLRELPQDTLYRLSAKAEGHADAPIQEVRSGTLQNIVRMDSGGAIMGAVKDFNTGLSVAQVAIVARRTGENQTLFLRTRTTPNGTYRLSRLPAGTYDVTVSSDRWTTTPKLGIEVAANSEVKDINFDIYPGVAVSGIVVDGDTNERIAGAEVKLESQVGPDFLLAKKSSAPTDEDGSFEFQNLPYGIYRVYADLSGYVRDELEGSYARVEIKSGDIPEPIELTLFRGGIVEGVVTTEGGQIIPDAMVQIYRDGGSPSKINVNGYKAKTNSGGVYTIEGIPLNQELHLYATAYKEGFSKGLSELFVLRRSQPIRVVPITLPDSAILTVTVKGDDNSFVNEADINIYRHASFGNGTPDYWRGKTDEMGRLLFDDLSPGVVYFSVSASGYLSGSGKATVEVGVPAEEEVTLEKAYSIAGRVIDDLLMPISTGSVTATPQKNATSRDKTSIKPDSTFLLEKVNNGTYRLDADIQKKTSSGTISVGWSFENVMPNNGMTEILLTVPSSGILTGKVQGAEGVGPPSNYTVRLDAKYTDGANRTRGFRAQHTFSGDPEWRFEGLPPGSYTVSVYAANHLPVEAGPFEVTSPGQASAGTIIMKAGGTLKLRVIDAISGEAIQSVLATLSPDGPSGRTNARGELTLSPIVPGMYRIELQHAEYLDFTRDLIQIRRNREEDIGTLELPRGGVIFGRLTDGDNNPISGFSVEADSVSYDAIKSTRTDASGNYRLVGLQPGGHVVTFAGKLFDQNLSKSITVLAYNDQETEQDVVLQPEARLIGNLIANPYVDVSRALISVYPVSLNDRPITRDPINTVVGEGNSFLIESIAFGRYLITAQAPSLETGTTSHWFRTVLVDEKVTTAWVAEGSNTLNGVVSEYPDGPPMKNQEVRLELISSPLSRMSEFRKWWLSTATTDSSGRFSIKHLPPGTYSLVANNDSMKEDILEFINLDQSSETRLVNFSFLSQRPNSSTQQLGGSN